jgi:hypothetical protein
MGMFGWLSGDKEKKQERMLDRLKKRLMNKHQQTAERKRAILTLEEMGSEDAFYILLGRFTYHTEGTIIDEDEKTMVFDVLRRAGDKAIPSLELFVREEIAIYWPLRALSELAGEDYAVDVILASLDSIEDRWEISMERMTQLASCLRDYNNPKVLDRLVQLSTDEFEEIRFLAVDGLSTFDNDAKAIDAIIRRLIDEDETVRVKTFVTDLLLERRWNVKKYKKQLLEKIPDHYFIDGTGVIQRR